MSNNVFSVSIYGLKQKQKLNYLNSPQHKRTLTTVLEVVLLPSYKILKGVDLAIAEDFARQTNKKP